MELTARTLKIGWITNAFKSLEPAVAKVADAAEKSMRRIFPSIKRATLPAGPWDDAANLTMAVEGAASFRDLIRSGQVSELADPLCQVNGYINESYTAADYVLAQRIREQLQHKMLTLFDTYDILAAPTLPITATTLDTNLETALSYPDPMGA